MKIVSVGVSGNLGTAGRSRGNPMPDDGASAVGATRRHGVDRTLEAVEHPLLALYRRQGEGTLVVVTTHRRQPSSRSSPRVL